MTNNKKVMNRKEVESALKSMRADPHDRGDGYQSSRESLKNYLLELGITSKDAEELLQAIENTCFS